MNCVIFLTHNFKDEFLKQLIKLDSDNEINNYDIVVLFDNKNTYDIEIDKKFKNIRIIKTNITKTSYDPFVGGHTMYINYFRDNKDIIEKYQNIWILENDVYYPNSFIEFFKIYDTYNYDLLVSEYGTRDINWYWRYNKNGFINNCNVGVYGFIMRLSKRLLLNLIENLDKNYFGYLEVILPHICLDNNFSIQEFIPDTCGIVTVHSSNVFLKLIENDIKNNTKLYIEDKIYHPIKL
jgi:hypothetical protein